MAGEADEADELETLRALSEHCSDRIILLRPDGLTEGEMALGATPLGYPPEARDAERHVAEHVHPDDLAGVLSLLEEVRARPGIETSLQVRARHYDGSWQLLDVDVIDRRSDPRLDGIVLRIRALGEAESGDRDEVSAGPGDDERFRSLAEVVPFGILSADRRGYVVHANREVTRILGLPPEHLYGQGWEAVVEAEDRPEVASASGAVLSHSDRERVTFRAHVRGETRWLNAVFVPLGDGETPTGWIATLDDVTDRRHAEMRLAHQATHDTLTGLPNRMLLGDRLGQAVARLERDPRPLGVLYLDLDRFKPVNDEYGHAVGDEVLVEVARRLRMATRAADTVGRVGGDEFVVVCEDMDHDSVGDLAERITSLIVEPLLVAGISVTVGVSVGAVVTTEAAADPAVLLAEADHAMYRSKQAGGSTVSIAG